MPLLLVSQQKSAEQDDQVELRFESQSSHQSCLTAYCMLHHPFFVRNKGNISWATVDIALQKCLVKVTQVNLTALSENAGLTPIRSNGFFTPNM